MRTILAPVDFSSTSANALAFAAELSKRISARLIVVNVLQKNEAEEEVKNKLESIESNLKKSFGSGFQCESLFAHGNLITTLKNIIAIQQPDIVVMGTTGASGLKKFIIGSNTMNVIAKTNVPVLVIPEVARFENFLNKGKNRIVLASDLEYLENKSTLDVLMEIALIIINPKIRVLNVRPENTMLPIEKRAERTFLLSLFNPKIKTERITIFSKNVIEGINFYLNENNDSGLLAMITHDRGQLIRRKYTREMVSHIHLPLLIMRNV